jgi:hypothetical protein
MKRAFWALPVPLSAPQEHAASFFCFDPSQQDVSFVLPNFKNAIVLSPFKIKTECLPECLPGSSVMSSCRSRRSNRQLLPYACRAAASSRYHPPHT